MLRRKLLAFILLLLASSSAWFLSTRDKTGAKSTTTSLHGRDYFMEDVVSVVMNKDGNPKYRLSTTQLSHYPTTQHAKIKHPLITLYNKGKATWTIHANEGLLFQDPVDQHPLDKPSSQKEPGKKNDIQLTGDVIVQQVVQQDNPQLALKVTTQSLSIDPDKQLVRTNQAVYVSSNLSSIEGIGMYLDIENQQLSLKSNVRGTYVAGIQ